MTSVEFHFNAEERLQAVCRLAAQIVARGERLLIYAPEPEVASRLDRLMWTSPATGFVPHCASDDALAPATPVLIARDDEAPADVRVLVNLAAECPPHYARFERLVEVVGTDEVEREAGRNRYREYKARGYAISNHDLAKANG
ncbi:MAG: DNA polymerase III subunit chi [Burkholderiales bacterium]